MRWLDAIVRDVRYALRMLAARPGWTIAAIACLAIATGANTAAFSVVNAVLLRPLPFPQAEQLVMVALKSPDTGEPGPFALDDFRAVSAAAGAAELAAWSFLPLGVSANRGAEIVEGQLVSGNYFDVLRVTPLAGRFFDAGADRPGSPAQVVISERFWRVRFSSDPAAVGATIRVNSQPMTVTGVAPPGFVGAMGLVASDIWVPAVWQSSLANGPAAGATPMFGVFARRSPSMTTAQTEQAISAVVAGLARDKGPTAPVAAIVEPAAGFGVPPSLRRYLPAVMAVVFLLAGLLVFVAAANVAALVMARGTRRVREMGLRLALGASRSRVAGQLLTESLVLAALGSVAGMILAFWITAALQPGATTFDYVSYAVDITPDMRVFAYAVVGAFVTAGVFGVLPAYAAGRTDLMTVLKPAGGAGAAPTATRSLQVLVCGQIAVSTVLLIAGGLLGRSFLNAQAVDPGFDTHHLLSVSLDVNQARVSNEVEGRRIFSALQERLGSLPGVEGVSLTRESPLSLTGRDVPVWSGERVTAAAQAVSAGHFALLGIEQVQGRSLTSADATGSRVAVINETMAQRLWPGGSPLDRSFHLTDANGPQLQVVGVVKDVKRGGLTEMPVPTFYELFDREFNARATVLLRSRLSPDDLIASVRAEIATLDPDLPAMQIGMLDDQVARARAPRGRLAFVLAVVGAIGLSLAVVGLYGVTSFGVRSRSREFGIRLALGATASSVRRLVVTGGLRTVGIGIAIGIGASMLLGRVFAGLLFGVAVSDPLTIGVVVAALAAVASLALYLPARWATHVDPNIALRAD